MFASKYPEILIDKSKQSPTSMAYVMSVEEFYDIMHHSHEGLSDCIESVKSINNSLEEIIRRLDKLERSDGGNPDTVAGMRKEMDDRLKEIEDKVSNSIFVADYEAVNPGTDTENP